MREKYDAVNFFKKFVTDMQVDKYNKASFDFGVGFIGKNAYICNNIMCGRLKVYDNLPCSPLYWSYECENSVRMPDELLNRIRGYEFDKVSSKVIFLRVKDIRAAIPKLTPLKKCVSNMRIEADNDTVMLSAVKHGLTLSQIYCKKNFYSGKEVSKDEDFQGVVEINLFYLEKIALENSFNCDIIGIRLKNNSAQIFARKENKKVDYIIKIM